MWNLILFIDRVKEKLFFLYRMCIFKGKIKQYGFNLKILGKIYVNATNVKVGNNVTIYPGVYFWGDGEIIIGDNVDIGIGTIIFAKKKVEIGNNSLIAANCYIIDSNHGISKNKLISDQPLQYDEEGIILGNDVWLGAGCEIVKGAKINDGAVIGAMSLVNCEIEEYAVAFGVPAKIFKYRVLNEINE
jgi:acetyltransferase-like isoleucine patch superfamily enzyme